MYEKMGEHEFFGDCVCALVYRAVPFAAASAGIDSLRSSGEDCFPCRGGCGFGGTVLPAYHFMLRIAAELSALAAGACRPEGLCIRVRV